jgi:hypothetical protein
MVNKTGPQDRAMKPQLPMEIQRLLPEELVRLIDSYVPHLKKAPTPKASPSLEREVRGLQLKYLHGCTGMYLDDLEDFILDAPPKKAR